ncbi:patatin-like phospholipase family protein [Candidatus Venteria ishoeyi]|uniref:patatin-like phospholipase family protein n=1 Tax=Candidatus Venteria ishoeyi TaxID=1899563 RepID=UPI0025A4D5AA|nr:patatin-like phospholipase family protein [Candidatus Venteria ishoeyi]MDM8548260.1 patatin-like phospholipase family protein [Candidatus Venteria ishoeyi]
MKYHILKNIILSVVYSFFCLFALHLQAENQTASRPGIGLVLSGGGALGFTHIGALQALEALHVPVDYVTGTSMGSIVGGLYAAKVDVPALEKAVMEINWDKVFDDSAERQLLSFREKQRQLNFAQFEVGFSKKGFSTPAAIVGGQNLIIQLERLTGGLQLDDFNALPIPFKAVAVDLKSAKQYILEKGNLAMAMRASMAVPSVFAPIAMNGALLVDGGLLNNMPVQLVKDMGADLVIAINVSSKPSDIDASASLLKLAQQSTEVVLIQNMLVSMKKADIVIAPDLEGHTSLDFDAKHAQDMIKRGYQAVMDKAVLFKGMALSPAAYARHKQQQKQRIISQEKVINPQFIRFQGITRGNENLLYERSKDLLQRTLNRGEIENKIKQLNQINEFERITYDTLENEQGETGLLFDVREKSWGPNYLRFGASVSSAFDDRTLFNLVLRHERLSLNALGGEWINELSFGRGYQISTKLYQPLDYQDRFFVEPTLAFGRNFQDVIINQQALEYRGPTVAGGLKSGINFSNWGRLSTGAFYQASNLKQPENSVVLPEYYRIKSTEAGLRLLFEYDTLDQRLFSRHGLLMNLMGEVSSFDFKLPGERHEKLKNNRLFTLYARYVTPLAKAHTLITDINLGTSSDTLLSMGHYRLLTGYAENDLRVSGADVALLRMGDMYRPQWLQNALSNSGLEIMFHGGKIWDNPIREQQKNLYYGGSIALLWDTPMGILRMGSGYSNGGELQYFLSFGHIIEYRARSLRRVFSGQANPQ